MNLEQRKDVRFHFLGLLYKLTEGKELKFVDYRVLGVQLGLDDKAAFKVAQYLAEEGLLRFRSATGLLTITHGGVSEVKDSLSDLDDDSSHFASEVASAVSGSSSGQAREEQDETGIAQPVTSSELSAPQILELREIIRLTRMSMKRLNLQEQEELNMDADIRTIEAQLSSSRPRRTILLEALDSLHAALENAANGASMPVLLAKMAALSRTARVA